MAFTPITRDSGKSRALEMAASTTITKGDALKFDTNGFVVPSVSTDAEVLFSADETKTSAAASNPLINVTQVRETEYIADTASNTTQAQVGDKVDLASATTLANTASSNDVFLITDLVGISTDKQVKGYFVQKTS